MQIVIDISNWLYNAIMECKEPLYSKSLGDAVRDGTPLPKGHGKIADLSAVYEDICNDLNKMTRIGVVVDGGWLWAKLNDAIDHAPTIIEADTDRK